MSNPLKPSAALLCRLGSIAVHADEMLSRDGHQFDKTALLGLLDDPQIIFWLAEMDKMAMVPRKRKP